MQITDIKALINDDLSRFVGMNGHEELPFKATISSSSANKFTVTIRASITKRRPRVQWQGFIPLIEAYSILAKAFGLTITESWQYGTRAVRVDLDMMQTHLPGVA